MSEMPFYFCGALLTGLLIWREAHHARITRGLIDKILLQRGLEPIPESHPLAGVLEALGAEEKTSVERMNDELKRRRRIRMPPEAIHFKIPGMNR